MVEMLFDAQRGHSIPFGQRSRTKAVRHSSSVSNASINVIKFIFFMESIVPPRKPKKPIEEMTSEELLKFVFPSKKLRDELKRIAHAEKPKRQKKS